jgi:glucan phosphoethanolaminetransferase (alkaline phosphatase superfamily)
MKSTRTRFVIGSLLLLLGWILLALAEFNASYKVAVNGAPVGNGVAPSWTAFVRTNSGELLQYLAPKRDHLLFVLLFFFPALAILLPFGTQIVKKVMIVGIIVLSCVDLAVLAAYDGGDRTGCEICFVGGGLHLLFGIGSVLVTIIAIISAVSWKRRV